jgi:hypothetical protein
MNLIRQYGQAAGWVLFLTAFLITALAPDAVWYAIPLYVIGGGLFIAVLLNRRRVSNNR